MNTTIAVAIITALATIGGGSAAGIIGLAAQRRQDETQRETRRLQMRRDAYVALLAEFDEILAATDRIWNDPPPRDRSVDVFESLRTPVDYHKKLRIAHNTVYLEGPVSVRRAAAEFVFLLREERKMISSCAQDHVGKPGVLKEFWKNRDEALAKRDRVKNEFLDQAAMALGIERLHLM
jgi:hypothetical protein